MRLPPPRVVFSSLDQVVSSVTNVLLSVAVARVASPEVYAQMAIAVTTMVALLTVTRQSVGAHLVSLGGSPRTPGDGSVRAALGVQVVLAPLAAVGPAVLLLAAPRVDTGALLIVLAVVSPMVLLQDALRYVASSQGRAGAALLSDSLWLVVFLAAWPLAARTDSPAFWLVTAWGFGALVSYIVLAGATRQRPAFRTLGRWWTEVGPAFSRLLGDGALTALTPLGIVAIIGVGLPLMESGAYLATSVLFGPVNVLLMLFSFVLSAEAERVQDRRRATRVFCGVAAGSGVAIAGYGLLLMLLPDAWGVALLGPTWAVAEPLLPIRAVEAVTGGLLAVLFSYWRWLRRYDLQLASRSAMAVLSIVAVALACLWSGTAGAVALAAAVATVVVLLLSMALQRTRGEGSRAEGSPAGMATGVAEPAGER